MKGILRLVVILGLLAAAQSAFAAGFIDLRWDDCSPTGVVNKDYTCNLTTGVFTMVASFDPGVTYTGPDAIDADIGVIDLIATSLSATQLPDYWKFQVTPLGGCGGGTRMIWDANFTGGPFSCVDMWGGLAGTGGQFGGKNGSAPEGNTARIKWSSNVTQDVAVTATAGQIHYVEKINIKKDITACPGGCADEVCLVFNQYSVSTLSAQAPIWNVDVGGVQPPYITWQQGGSPVFNCPIPTPTRNRTWGEIKSLYR